MARQLSEVSAWAGSMCTKHLEKTTLYAVKPQEKFEQLPEMNVFVREFFEYLFHLIFLARSD
jgi:hypothetical protein